MLASADGLSIELHDVLGTIGVVLIVGAYLALQLERIDPKRMSYSLANAVGSILILISLYTEFNWSAALVEIFWLAVSLIGIVRNLRRS